MGMSPEQIRGLDGLLAAANYLTVGQISFFDEVLMTDAAFSVSVCKEGKWSSRSRSDALMMR